MDYPLRELNPSEFPALLREIPDAPKKLFLAGKLPIPEHKLLSIVGSRAFSPYGREVTEKLVEGLRGYPISIVSGLALGIDSIAHKVALAAGLQTIAVPGSGLSTKVLYPRSNLNLARKIIENGGGLLSEFEPSFEATPWGFPRRNRIMAGMSHATLVIEADIKSGTLITSKLATEYNRDVLTVPGSIFGKLSAGPHMLLRLGATPIRDSGDILEVFGFTKEEAKEKNYSDCSPEEKKILKLVRNPLERDELIRLSGLTSSEANTTLAVLELKGLIEEFMGEIHLA